MDRTADRTGDMAAIAARAPVIPVLTIEQRETAVPLTRALVRGGLPVLEITLRTGASLEAIRAVAAEVPEAIVGAETVLDPAQLEQVQRAGSSASKFSSSFRPMRRAV